MRKRERVKNAGQRVVSLDAVLEGRKEARTKRRKVRAKQGCIKWVVRGVDGKEEGRGRKGKRPDFNDSTATES